MKEDIIRREIAEFGVPVDENDARLQWSNHRTEVQEACVRRIEEIYAGRTGEIVFYGPSNITLWYSLEQDMLPYKAQNHGMGGCIDPEMIKYAPRLLYAFKPRVVFFQTGSNDLAGGMSLDQILANKRKMYDLYLEQMPETKLVVMSGLPLPGRQQYWADTVKTNQLLAQMCAETDRMYFMDATDVMLTDAGPEDMRTDVGDKRTDIGDKRTDIGDKRTDLDDMRADSGARRYFNPALYRSDGIHLNKHGHDVWTREMKKILEEI